MKLYFLHHLQDHLEKFCSVQFRDAAPPEQLNVVLKRAHIRPSMKRVAKIRKTASASRRIKNGLKMKGRDADRKDQFLMEARQLQMLEEMGSFHGKN